MKIRLEYGENGLMAEIPDQNVVKVMSMKQAEVIADPTATLVDYLKSPIESAPLAELAKGKKSACVVICDITRPVPNKILLPPILKTLEESGIPRENIKILIATGIHRPNLGDELIYLVGEEIAANYTVLNHYAKEKDQQAYLGETSRKTAVWIDKTFVDAELKITTGFIEPHLMAGFSGGRKLVVPGIASLDTVKVMHGPKILESPHSREGVIDGNPFHEEAVEIANMSGIDFIVNVSLNESRQITGIYAGHPVNAHLYGISQVRKHVGDTVPEPVDVVVTTCAGYPLDATFYQTIKGMTAALPIVKEGGTIILAAECREGLGSPEFTKLVYDVEDMKQFMEDIFKPDYFIVDQWQFEEFAKVLRKCDVIFVSSGLSTEEKQALQCQTAETVEAALEKCYEKSGSDCSIAVIPKGPYILTGTSA